MHVFIPNLNWQFINVKCIILTSFGSSIADPTINIQQLTLLSKDWPESFGILIPTYQSLLVKIARDCDIALWHRQVQRMSPKLHWVSTVVKLNCIFVWIVRGGKPSSKVYWLHFYRVFLILNARINSQVIYTFKDTTTLKARNKVHHM